MRFRHKIIGINLIILSVALGFLGFTMIYQNFSKTLSIQAESAIEENVLLQSSMEYRLLDTLKDKKSSVSAEYALKKAGEACAHQFISPDKTLLIYYGENLAYSDREVPNEPPKSLFQSLELGKRAYVTAKDGDGHYYLYVGFQSILYNKDLFIVTAKNVDGSYLLLNRQIQSMVLAMAIVLIFSTVLLYLTGKKLTKPLEQLNEVTDTIAKGDYSIRADISSNDEIGELAGKFNDMTLAVAMHVEELGAMIKQREQFVADFTHEIKTPMTAIIGYADIMQKKQLPEDLKRLACEYIFSEGKRLEAMSMKLFDLIYLKDHELLLCEKDALMLAREVETSVKPLLERDEITLTVDVKSHIIYCEPELLSTVFINLLDNARKASKPGSRILFTGEAKEQAYEYRVQDFGCGMSEETMEHICDEFYMADKSRSRKEGGAGLGMSLSALILKRHNAELLVESKLGEGSTLTVRLPL